MSDRSSTENHRPGDRIGLGIGLMLIGTGVFVSMDGVIKYVGLHGIPTLQILFFRNVFAFLPVGFFIARNGGLRSLKTRRPMGHFVRAVIGLSAMGLIFWSYREMSISNVTAIMFSAPIFMTVLSIPMLNEQVGIRRWCAVIVGFIGVLIIVRPDQGLDVTSLIVVGATVFYAIAMILVRRLSDTEHSVTIVFYFTLAGTLITLLLVPFVWVAPASPAMWGWLIGVGLLGGVAQLLITYGIRYAPISVLAPFEYTALIWASGIDIIFFNLYPGVDTLWGAAVIAATGLYIVHRETRLGRRQEAPARLTRTRVASADRDPPA